jgi:putative ABC transport system permease protein
MILLQFLTEAIVLSLLGGIIGYGLSVAGGFVVSKLIGFSIPITVSAIMLAFGVSIGVGVVFGVAPAIRAAKKHPIDALRYE